MTNRSLMRGLVITIGFLSICFVIAGAVKAQTEQPKQVLILHSYHKGFVWTDAIQDGIEAAFGDSDLEFELHIEYMDTKRFPDEENYEHLRELYRSKYKQHALDVIVSSDDNALRFLLREGQDLFPGVPVVFCGVDHFSEDLVAPHRERITGVAEGIDIKASLDLGLRLRPSTKHVVVAADTSPIGEANKAAVRELAPHYQDRVDFTYLSDLTLAELQEELRGIPEDSMVLYLHFSLDRTGTYHTLQDSIAAISEASPSPVYGSWDFSVKYGVTGGYVTNGFVQGHTAASMALRILSGEDVSDVEIVRKSPNTYMFNYEQMERFRISESDLPEGSIVINKSLSFYEEFKYLVWGVVSVIVSLLALVAFLVRNIVIRRRMEEALRESEELFRLLFELAPIGMAITALDGQYLRVNQALCDTLGYSAEELLAGGYADITHPDDLALNLALREESLRGEAPYFIMEKRYITKEGKVVHALLQVTLVRDSDDRPLHFIGQIVDITERVQAESRRDAALSQRDATLSQREAALEALRESNLRLEEALAELRATQEQIVQQERLAAVGQLAAGIAHDFNNLLTSIIGFAELLLMSPDIPQAAQPDLARIVEQGRRAAHLVRQILDFSRKTIRQPHPLNLTPFLKEAVKFLERTIPESIHILLETEPLECLIQADPTQLQQMVTNLALNARDAMPAGGELRLRLSRLTLKPGEGPPCPELPPGEWVVFSVSDTGTGIPAEVLPHIFEPFFTTRAPEGSGLGLAQVYGIVKQHEGYIDVESQVGKGATFTIYLPALVAGEQAPPRETPEDLPRGQGETILLVEDEAEVLEVSQALLEHLGYRVLAASGGRQALELYAAHAHEVALVMTDMVMPEMDGMTLFHVLKAQTPGVKVVLISGYPLEEEAQEIFAQGIIDWLPKPLTLAQLAEVTSRALRPHGSGVGSAVQRREEKKRKNAS